MCSKSKIPLSGEVLKENFTDVFYTNLEVIAFSLLVTEIENLPLIQGILSKKEDRFPINIPAKKSHLISKPFIDNFCFSKIKNSSFKNFVSLNIKVGDYLSSGDKIGVVNRYDVCRTKKRSIASASSTLPLQVEETKLLKQLFLSRRGKFLNLSLQVEDLYKAQKLRHILGFTSFFLNAAKILKLPLTAPRATAPKMQSAGLSHKHHKYKSWSLPFKAGKQSFAFWLQRSCKASVRPSINLRFVRRFVLAKIAPYNYKYKSSPSKCTFSAKSGICKKICTASTGAGLASVKNKTKITSPDFLKGESQNTLRTDLQLVNRKKVQQQSTSTNPKFVRRFVCTEGAYKAKQSKKQSFFPYIPYRNRNIKFSISTCTCKNICKKMGAPRLPYKTFYKTPLILPSSGRVLTISKTQLILQKTQPVLFYDSANLHVKKGEWVKEGAPILTLTHQTLITGDIVQGIPRIEQLFEAFTSPPPGLKEKKGLDGSPSSKFKNVHDTLHSQVRDIFRKNWLKSVLPIAVRKSLQEIQYLIVEMIQKVYLSQGVLIADKHIEIIIRQMTSKGQILDSGSTGLLLEEVLPIRQIENANITTPGKKCLYVPAVVGLTAAALTCDSFISAASFQETTRVLSRDAVVGKSDFLRGLKEKVVIGDLISAGTGLDIYFIYTLFAESI